MNVENLLFYKQTLRPIFHDIIKRQKLISSIRGLWI